MTLHLCLGFRASKKGLEFVGRRRKCLEFVGFFFCWLMCLTLSLRCGLYRKWSQLGLVGGSEIVVEWPALCENKYGSRYFETLHPKPLHPNP